MPVLLLGLALAVLTGGASYLLLRRRAGQPSGDERDKALEVIRRLQEAAVEVARSEAENLVQQAEVESRAEAQRQRAAFDQEEVRFLDENAAKQQELSREELGLSTRLLGIEERGKELSSREQSARDRDANAKARRDEARKIDGELQGKLEEQAGEKAADIQARLVAGWVEEARAEGAERIRRVEAGAADPEYPRLAKRALGISMQRFNSHYLTERLLSNLPIAPDMLARIAGAAEENLRAIEEISHVTLTVGEARDAIRLEGQDSFGREVARRAISRLTRNPLGSPEEVRHACQVILEDLEREVGDLGRKAFKELGIPRAHPDIVKLVGRLNYRASYTQNQWKHAIEAAFLCGMMAAELGLDVKIARRAALMHDIGKALSHEIDGSHALIGADLARRHGESEVVANAIGAHHGEEPFDSTYALLVAGADAASGGRPGARRQQDENYVERIQDLERIAGAQRGVDRVYAVQGGREVRIYVQEDRISDVKAVEMSSEIARRISDEMTFPGQIKVTVIREVRAVEIAS